MNLRYLWWRLFHPVRCYLCGGPVFHSARELQRLGSCRSCYRPAA
jgi:hypothetical protein